LIGRAERCIGGQCPLGFFVQFFGGFERVFYSYSRNFEHPVHILHFTFNIGFQVFGGLYSARIQRAGKRAGESPGNSRHHIIQGGWVVGPFNFSAVFVLVKIPDAAVNAEMNGLVKAFQMGCSMRACMLFDLKGTGVRNGHGFLLYAEIQRVRSLIVDLFSTGCHILLAYSEDGAPELQNLRR